MPKQGEVTLPLQSIGGRAPWVAASVMLAVLSVAYGSTLLVVASEASWRVPLVLFPR